MRGSGSEGWRKAKRNWRIKTLRKRRRTEEEFI